MKQTETGERILIICESNFYNNTLKIAKAMQNILKAPIVKPSELDKIDFNKYDVIGLGSGIKFARHDEKLMEAAKKYPITNKKVFIFSTRCNPWGGKYHNPLKKIVVEKGCTVIGEFSTFGFDNTGPFAIIGGYHKGRPNQWDLKKAEKFAKKLNITPPLIDPLKNKNIKEIKSNTPYKVYEGNVGDEHVVVHGTMVSVNWSKCIGCGKCEEVCPLNVFQIKQVNEKGKMLKKMVPINEDYCVLCQKCEKLCPSNAVYIRFTWKDALNVVKKHENFYEK